MHPRLPDRPATSTGPACHPVYVKSWHRGVVATAAVAGLAWGVVASRGGDAKPLVLHADGNTILVAAPIPPNMQVAGVGLVGGVITSTRGCLRLHDRALVWPAGTKIIDKAPLTLYVPGKGAVRIGDRLFGGGGGTETGQAPPGLFVPTGCLTPELVYPSGR